MSKVTEKIDQHLTETSKQKLNKEFKRMEGDFNRLDKSFTTIISQLARLVRADIIDEKRKKKILNMYTDMYEELEDILGDMEASIKEK